MDELRKVIKTKVLAKSAFDLAAEKFAMDNKSLLAGLRKARFKELGRRLSQELDAGMAAAAVGAAVAA